MPEEPFTPADAEAVHSAARQYKAGGEARKEKMPSSAEALRRHAERLEIVRDKILERLPPEQRARYPKRQ